MYLNFQTPETSDDWSVIARGFGARWNFPNCIGGLDGKHVRIVPPKRSGILYRNYKGTYSVVLMALVDHNYEFVYVDVGAEGKAANGGIWKKCSLKKRMDAGSVGIPKEAKLPNTNVETPFVIVGDDAFKLGNHLMKPFSRRELSLRQAVFNYRLSRARRVSENAFGILANRFRVFLTNIHLLPETVVDVILAGCCLHNLLRRRCGRNYLSPGSIDQEDADHRVIPALWRRNRQQMDNLRRSKDNNPSISSKAIREVLADYFMSQAGEVPWQYDMVSP